MHRRFPVNFAKFLRTPILQNTSCWRLLKLFAFLRLIEIQLTKVKMFVNQLVHESFWSCFHYSFLTTITTWEVFWGRFLTIKLNSKSSAIHCIPVELNFLVLTMFKILQLWAKFETMMVSYLKFWWITNSSNHNRI